jgi:flagellar basal-body rod protein FlgG
MFVETAASGPPTTGTPGQVGLGEIEQGYLEMSNVEVVKELVDLIIAQRTYELNSKVVKAGDRVLQVVNTMTG